HRYHRVGRVTGRSDAGGIAGGSNGRGRRPGFRRRRRRAVTAPRYEMEFWARALKRINALDKPLRRRVWNCLAELCDDPRPAGCLKLVGYKNRWRVRVGDYRIVYAIADADLLITVTGAGHRGSIYDSL